MRKLLYFSLIAILVLLLSCKDNEEAKTQNTNGTALDSIELVKLWETDTLLTTAESLIWDQERDVLYVACINGVSPWIHDGDGFIAKIDLEGNILEQKWVEGLSGPKGMGIVGDQLFVTDINQVVQIDIPSASISARIPIEGGININDLTTAHDGDVFVSDSKGSSIYKITNGEVSTILRDSSLVGINGLYMMQDTLVFASYNEGRVYRIQHDDRTPKELAKLPKGGDGVEKFKDGFIVSSWVGRIYYLNDKWQVQEVLNSEETGINSADIEVIASKDLLLVPTFFDNRVVAYRVKGKG